MCVHRAHAVLSWSRTHAASNGFVVRELPAGSRINAADSEVVHCSLAGCGNSLRQRLGQCREQNVDDSLRGFDIAASHRSGMSGIDDCSCRRHNLDWFHQSRTRGHVSAHQTAEDIGDGRHGDCFNSIDCSGSLRRAACKIHTRPVAANGDPNTYGNRLVTDTIVIE